ncbi:two-component sensor histidine kinase [Collibacillus ludicampi]|uniref:histidine kinase n=1 Tax=Collibacillus ludicampi TaxID=2771369 RepID=A0AAV4LDC9_9BACL|nr:sensor histidine kinase [Collibacillus ludicampi]GIM45731.1 two-component sensor histidine kinase [Collibacillus ludicampi]
MFGIKDLLLNILIIIIGILIYYSIKIEQRFQKLIIGLISVTATVACMIFPFTIVPGNIYDLRSIPILLGFLYGGYEVGLADLLAALLYRYGLGGYGFYTALYSAIALVGLTVFFVPLYQTLNRKRRILTAMAIAFSTSLLIALIGYYRIHELVPDSKENILVFFAGFCFLHVLAMWVSVHLIENMRENKAMEIEMQKAEKLHVLGELAASIAHEIRNPMTVVRGFVQLLCSREVSEEDKRYMKLIIDELDRAEEIINDYLSLTKPQIEKAETFDVVEHVRHIANVLSSCAKPRNVEIEMKGDSSCSLTTNQVRFSQVLVNLMKNGIEAMTKGGTLQVFVCRKDEHVIIEIIDTGVGMTRDEINRLGTPFYSTKEKGTGLGLMASYRIVQLMNGKIQVDSEKGKGTCFSIILPQSSRKEI